MPDKPKSQKPKSPKPTPPEQRQDKQQKAQEQAQRKQEEKSRKEQKAREDKERKQQKAAEDKKRKEQKAVDDKTRKEQKAKEDKERKNQEKAKKEEKKREKQQKKEKKEAGRLPSLEEIEQRKESLPLAQLNEEEERFFEVIEEGDVKEAEKFLDAHPKLNVNCHNYEATSALHLAIQSGEEEMVKMLLGRPDIKLEDGVLHAVESGNTVVAEILLNFANSQRDGGEYRGCPDSPHFPPDATPLMLAAQNSDYEMVRLLLDRKHVLLKPHIPSCLCEMCKQMIEDAGASISQVRLNAYRAIANPAYICQVTDDPFLYGFTLDRELKDCAQMEKEFTAEYKELSVSVREFTVALVGQCRNPDETEIVLKVPRGFHLPDRVGFPRLQLALINSQKEFVAHSMVQQVLSAHWLGEFRVWPRLSITMKVLHVIFRIIILPFICFFIILSPKNMKLGRNYRAPVNRFLLSLAAYLVFLVCVFALNMLDTNRFSKGAPATRLEPVIVIFVLGNVFSIVRQIFREGLTYFQVLWNVHDFVTQVLFVTTFILWIKADSDSRSGDSELERKYWPSNQSTLLHEGLFSIASVLTFGKLAYYCLQSSRLGPLQVSLGKMFVQIAYFMILGLLINIAFAIPLTRMYAYYQGMTETAGGSTRTQLDSFTTLGNSFATLFWGMFGMSPVESADVVVDNTDGTSVFEPVSHDFTQTVGRVLFATYEVLMIIALVNTLIAVLSNTFQRILDNADVEFKFARTKLWMHFFDDAYMVPPPFNLIPSARLLENFSKYFQALGSKNKHVKAKFSLARCCYLDYEKETKEDRASYKKLMRSLIQRYFRASKEEKPNEQ